MSIKHINDNFLDAAAMLNRLEARVDVLGQHLSSLDAQSVQGWKPGAFGIWSLNTEFTPPSSGFFQIPYDRATNTAPFGSLTQSGTIKITQSGLYDIRVRLRLSYSGRSDLRIQNALVSVNYSTDTSKTASIYGDSINWINANDSVSAAINFTAGGSVIASAARLIVCRLA
ncbi:MAG: hypothetical protein ACOYI4_01595 [Christensenellales bacterium]